MNSFTVRQSEDKTITFQVSNPRIALSDTSSLDYALDFSVSGLNIKIHIEAYELGNLVIGSLVKLGLHNQMHFLSYTDEFLRKNMNAIKKVDDELVKEVLHDCTSDSILYFCWFMDDDEINQILGANLSKRAKDLLYSELQELRTTFPLSSATNEQLQAGREAFLDVSKVLYTAINTPRPLDFDY